MREGFVYDAGGAANSQYANEAMQQRRQGEQIVVVHPNDPGC